jgi:hypothetical protein
VIKGDLAESLRERERLRDPEVRRQMREVAREAELASRQAAAHPITLAELRGHTNARSLRGAAVALAEQYGGWLEIRDGQLIVFGPALPSPHQAPSDAREIIETLVAGRAEIIEAVGGRTGRVDAGKLPNRPLSAIGVLL